MTPTSRSGTFRSGVGPDDCGARRFDSLRSGGDCNVRMVSAGMEDLKFPFDDFQFPIAEPARMAARSPFSKAFAALEHSGGSAGGFNFSGKFGSAGAEISGAGLKFRLFSVFGLWTLNLGLAGSD